MEMSVFLAQLGPQQLENWWVGFRKRRRITTRRISSLRRYDEELVMPLVKRFRCTPFQF
jgi:hypothetical protein